MWFYKAYDNKKIEGGNMTRINNEYDESIQTIFFEQIKNQQIVKNPTKNSSKSVVMLHGSSKGGFLEVVPDKPPLFPSLHTSLNITTLKMV